MSPSPYAVTRLIGLLPRAPMGDLFVLGRHRVSP